MEFNQAVVTTKGQALMAKLLAGSATTKFTKVATSSTVYQQSQLEGLTALTNVKQTVVPTSYENNASTVKVVAAINNEGLTDGYYINTVGLYATDSDGSEILYSVAIATVNGYMPPDTGVSKSGVELKIYTAVSNASNVDLTVDQAAVATIGDIAAVNENLKTKRIEEYGLFVDNRETATTGYWHKIFTCQINSAQLTNICLTLSVLGLYPAHLLPSGILTLNIRQAEDGVFYRAGSVFKWQSATVDMTNFLNRFAINVVTSAAGNYIEFYIYNNLQWAGYKVSVMDKHSRGLNSNLVFTGEKTGAATTTLTELPTNGTIIYSTLIDMVTKAEYNALADRVAALEAR